MPLKKHHLTISICILITVILSVVFYVGAAWNIPYKTIMGDPAFIADTHPFTGILSNIGVLVWFSGAIICLYTWLLLREILSVKEKQFYLISGLFTLFLLVDDFFMLHDYIFYSFKEFKITEPITYMVYAFGTILYLVQFKKLIIQKDVTILCIAVVFLGASVGVDSFIESSNIKHFIEDALKFIGICLWSYFFALSSYADLTKALKSA